MRDGNEGRRWPLVAAIGGVGYLLAALFPSPLSTPARQPGTSAEYAPLPAGAREQSLSVDAASSHGIASTDLLTTEPGSGSWVARPIQYRPRQTACVGAPPRQTEDLLSPPCVPFFEGPNGGATHPGVTADEIVVVVYNDHYVSGELDTPWKPSDEDARLEQPTLTRTFKAHRKHFTSRYQTYGRTVRMIAQASTDGWSTDCSERRNDARQTLALEPFAVVHVGFWEAGCYRDVIAKAGVMLFGLNYDIPREDYVAHAPNWWGFFPDQRTMAELSATFLCDKLHGRPARHAADPELKDRLRTFGFIRPRNAFWGPEREQIARQVERIAARRCGLRFINAPYTADGDASGISDGAAILQRFKADKVTTILCYCVTQGITGFQNGASSMGYFPEWFWDQPTTTALYAQLFADPKQRNFGISVRWRQPAFRHQHHYRVYQEQEPGSWPDPYVSFDVYYAFFTLFQGIQAAGPRLDPRSVQRGMFTFAYQDLDDPWNPTGGYGPARGPGSGTHTFIDTAMAAWWDPAGKAPGSAGGGCLRVAHEGRRVFAGGWPAGDEDLFTPDAPCTEGEIKQVDDSDPTT